MNQEKQSGAALILSLVILLILTVLGVTSMTTSTTQELLVRNIQDTVINYDCSETELSKIKQGLIEGTITVDSGQSVNEASNAGVQNIDINATNCAQLVNATYQFAGEKLIGVQGECALLYEITILVDSGKGEPIRKTTSFARNKLNRCS